jgi:hypothetical protein
VWVFHSLAAIEVKILKEREGGMVGIGQSLNQPFAKCKITNEVMAAIG